LGVGGRYRAGALILRSSPGWTKAKIPAKREFYRDGRRIFPRTTILVPKTSRIFRWRQIATERNSEFVRANRERICVNRVFRQGEQGIRQSATPALVQPQR
jgi:hypothetical protein